MQFVTEIVLHFIDRIIILMALPRAIYFKDEQSKNKV